MNVVKLYLFYLQKQKNSKEGSFITSILIEFLPSIVIAAVNLVVPEIFLALVVKEQYSNSTATTITLFR